MVSKSGVLALLSVVFVGAVLLGVFRELRPTNQNVSIERVSQQDPVDAARLIDPGGVGSRAPNLDVSNQLTDQYQAWLQGATN